MSDFNFRQNLDFLLVVIMGIAVFGFGLYMVIAYPHVTVRYDCSISEISPDYPVQVKEACRKLRAQNN
jgi:hypothetical protein